MHEPVRNGRLDVLDTTRLADGTYRLKLTAVDSIGQEPCRAFVERLRIANSTEVTATATATLPIVALPAVAGTPMPARDPGADARRSSRRRVAPARSGLPDQDKTDQDATDEAAAAEDGAAVGSEDTVEASSNASGGEAGEAGSAGDQAGEGSVAVAEPTAEDGATGAPSLEEGIALFEPATWASTLGLSALPVAFLGGMLLAVGVALLGIALYVVRSR